MVENSLLSWNYNEKYIYMYEKFSPSTFFDTLKDICVKISLGTVIIIINEFIKKPLN